MHIVCALIRFCSFLNLCCDIIVHTTPAYLTTLHILYTWLCHKLFWNVPLFLLSEDFWNIHEKCQFFRGFGKENRWCTSGQFLWRSKTIRVKQTIFKWAINKGHSKLVGYYLLNLKHMCYFVFLNNFLPLLVYVMLVGPKKGINMKQEWHLIFINHFEGH